MLVNGMSNLIYFRGENLPTQHPRTNIVLPIETEDAFVKQADAIDIDRLRDLNIKNFRLIDSNSVRGVCLTSAKDEIFNELKESGITTIIDLRREASNDSRYAQKCIRNGLEYFGMPVNDSMPVYCSLGNSRCTAIDFKNANHEFAKQLSEFFKLMDRGLVYMGCQLGLHRTDLAVVTNFLMNPNEPSTPPTLSHMFDHNEVNVTNKRISAVKNLYHNLSLEDKKMLGIAEYFYDNLLQRVTKLRMMNLR